MTTPKAEEEGILREWAPLSKFLRQIPLRTRHGIFLENTNLTCVSADIDCIAVGTTSGHVFLYNRESHEVHQLRPEKALSPVTCIAVVSSVEYMVASGDKLGVLTVFRIPKELPDWMGKPKEKGRIERYIIDELHTSRITALTWSTNGQKLFSGDASGVVVFVEVDHRMSITRACEVVNEKFKVVQLSYNQHHQALIVATDLRCIICRYNKPNWTIHQVGQRERNCLQELGACFVTNENLTTSAYCCRSGLRLWKANLEGTVEHTIKFKDIIESTSKPVKLLRPLKTVNNTTHAVPIEFGKLYHWNHGLMVSHWRNNLVVFDPSTIRVVATIRNYDGKITSVATTQKEIFVIMGHRELVRLSYFPDTFESSLGGFGNMASGEAVFGLPNFSFTPVIGIPLVSSPPSSTRVKLSAKTANSEPSANEVSFGIDSTSLLPSQAAPTQGVPELRVDSSRQHEFSSIGLEEFEEIIFTKHKRKKSNKAKTIVLDNNRNSGEFNRDDLISESGSSMTGSINEVNGEDELPASVDEAVGDDNCVVLFPDERPIDKIVEEFKMNEELLESTIVFPPSLVDLSPASDSAVTVVDQMESIEATTKDPHDDMLNECSPIENGGADTIEPVPPTDVSTLPTILENGCLETLTSQDSLHQPVPSCETSSLLEYMSESIDLISEAPCETAIDAIASNNEPSEPKEGQSSLPSYVIVFQNLVDGWLEMSCPDYPSCITVFSEGLVMCSPTFKVYFSEGDFWFKLPYEASQLLISPDGHFAVRLHYSSAYYSSNWRSSDNWKLLSRNVDSVCMENDKVWAISKGELYFMLYCSELVDRIECPLKLKRIYSYDNTLFGINDDGYLYMAKDKDWLPICGRDVKIKQFCCGPNNLCCIVDVNGKIQITDEIEKLNQNRWQLVVADFKNHDELILGANNKGLYIANVENKTIVVNTTSALAINWSQSDVKVDCVQLSAEGVFDGKGSIWALCKGNRLIGIPSTLDSINHVNVPCKVVCFACRPQALWLLSDDSEVYMKEGITDGNPLGAGWKKMSSEQLRGMQIQITHLSCGTDVVWACDIRGKILMLAGSPCDISNHSDTPAWVLVDGSALQNYTFTKVFVGPHCHMVWALDNAGNVYVREAIYPELLNGTSWVHVPGLKASHLSISAETVWALGHGGIYKRMGITERNFIGDIWTCVGSVVDYLSATIDENLLSVHGGWIQTYHEMIFPFSDEVMVEKDWTLL